jgi:ferredoxin-NADP reductase
MMNKYKVYNVDKRGSYVVLTLKPETSRDQMVFWAGQYATLSIKRNNHWSPVRCLSFTSISNQAGVLEFAFRVTGDFTRDLASSQTGDDIKVQGPYGDFVLHEDDKSVVLMAGGIGITPFISMLRTTAIDHSDRSVTLLYACRDMSDIPYEEDIRQIVNDNPKIKAYFFLSKLPGENRGYIKGPIDDSHLSSLVGERVNEFDYYICGPEGMMNSMTKVLSGMGVHEDNIWTESFSSSTKKSSKVFGLTPSQVAYTLSFVAFLVLVSGVGFKDIEHKLNLAQSLEPSTQVQQTTKKISPTIPESTEEDDDLPLSNTTTDNNLAPAQPITPAPSSSSTPSSANSTSSPTMMNSYQSPRSQVS